MKFHAAIDIMPLPELLDPQGKAVQLGLHNLGIEQMTKVRIGKHITLEVEADNHEAAHALVEEACKRLLANLIMERYSFEISPA